MSVIKFFGVELSTYSSIIENNEKSHMGHNQKLRKSCCKYMQHKLLYSVYCILCSPVHLF